MRLTIVASALLFFSSCGGNGLPQPATLSATITPSSAMAKTGGTIILTATVNGFTDSPIVRWWVEESHELKPSVDCATTNDTDLSFVPCPFGYIASTAIDRVPSIATYHAPPTAGTYHLVFRATQFGQFADNVSTDTTATVTVTP
jgi:hypothetical protein